MVGWGAFAAGLAAPALWCAYALLHFGTLISRRPEIDLVQGLPRRDILVHGALYLLNGLIRYPAGFVLPVLAVAGGICAVRSERKDPLPLMLASGALVYLAFCVWHGGDNVAGRMLCPFFFISALSLACGPAFRIRTYAFTAGFALVFFDLGKVFPERPNGAAVSRSEELFREWGITDDFARQHDGRHAPPRELAGLSAKEWKSRFASSGELVIAAEPGREGIRLGPGRAVRDWRSLGSERAELRGTLEATVRFKGAEPGVTEPVLSFGPPEDGTLLLAEHLPGSGLRFQIWKPGLVPVFSQSFPNVDSRIWHRLDVRYGAAAAGGDGKGRFVTMMDGILLKDFPGEARRSDFREIVAGWNVQNAPGCLLRFSGEIKDLRAAKEGVFASGRWPMTVGPRNLVEMRVRFSAVVNSSEPLLVTGRERAGDIVFCRRVGPGQALFGVEHWGQAPALGPVVEVDSTGYHVLQVALGPLFVHSAALLRPDCIRVTLDGRTVLETRQAPYPFSENEVSALDNPLAGSFCGRDFLGEKISVSVRSLDPLLKAAQRALEENVGPVSMDLRFDGTSTGLGLGLLEVGVSGDGCIVYAKNEDDGHVRLYFDHWGYGGITGSRVEVDRTKPHHLTIRMPALEAAGTVPPADADLVRFELDGRVVLEGRSPGAPARRDIIHLCENALLSSNVGAPFDGTCLSVSRGTAGVSFSY